MLTGNKEVKEQSGNRVWGDKVVNQKEQNPEWFDCLLNSGREGVEGSFNELQNTGRSRETLRAKTVIGGCQEFRVTDLLNL